MHRLIDNLHINLSRKERIIIIKSKYIILFMVTIFILILFLVTLCLKMDKPNASNIEKEGIESLKNASLTKQEAEYAIHIPTIDEIITTLCSDEFEGRKAFSKGNEKAGLFIADIFDKIGLNPLSENGFIQPYTSEDVNREDYINTETNYNVVGYIKGIESKKAIIISAHFDGLGVKEGDIFPGAMDNASGIAALIKIAEKLKQSSTENSFESNIIFCAFNGEEQLYVGSTAFVEQVKYQSWYENMYNINIDSIGAKNGGNIMFPTVSEYSEGLNKTIKRFMVKKDIAFVEFEKSISSDHRSFEKVGKANILITQEGWYEWIHKPTDAPNILDYMQIEKVANVLSDFIIDNDGTLF